jgi:Rad3-related DNA helicase
MDDVEHIVGSGGVLIAEACNGFGKTSSALSSLLALGRPILYATRTHEQVRQVLTEVIAINEKSGEKFTAVSLASRQHLCLNSDCQDLPQRELLEACRALKEGEGCDYRSDAQEIPRGLPPVLLPRKLIAVGEQKGLCPYYLARRIAKQSRVVVAPYAYVFDTIVRDSVGLSLSDRVLVLDEGHNLDKVGQESLSDTLSERSLDTATEELRSIGMPATHMKRLANHLREHISEEPVLQSSEALQRELETALGVDLHSFVNRYLEIVKAIRTRKMRQGEPPVCYLNGVLSFLSLVASSRKSQYIAVYQRSPYGAAFLEYRCLDPSLAVQPVIEEAAGALIMSGTLSPMNLFAEIVGLSSSEKRAYPPIQNSKNIRMVIDTAVTTRFKERSDEMILQVGKSIAADVAGVPNGVLFFFTQRQFMSRCLDVWGTSGVIEARGGRLYLGGKPLFVEGHDSEENREVVERYKEEAVGPKGAVLCCVFRGRNAEGSNFPDEEARGIFLVGVPYANYREPLVRAQISYFNGLKSGLGQRWYLMDAFRAANQALGRGIRSKNDWCHYWLLDRRYAEHINSISKWALGERPEIRE